MASVRKREWNHNGEPKTAWIVTYNDGSGTRRQKTFEKKKDADKFRDRVQSELERGEHTPDAATTTVKAVCEQFIRHNEQRMKDGTIGRSRMGSYKLAVDKGIVPGLGAVQFNALTLSIIERWWTDLRKGPLAHRTCRDFLQILGLVEKFAVRRNYTKRAVVADFKKEVGGAQHKPIRVMTTEHIGQLIAAAEVRPSGKQKRAHAITRCAVHLAAFCGLRYGEIMGLTVGNLDLDARVIEVRHNLTVWSELKSPKTAAGRRDVPLPSHVVDMLRDWLRDFYLPNERNLVFRTAQGGDMACTNFHKLCWRPLLGRAGLLAEGGDQFHFHALRHFAASWMIENGLPMTEVASLLGHRKFDTTLQIYAHPIVGGNRRHDTMERMASRLLANG